MNGIKNQSIMIFIDFKKVRNFFVRATIFSLLCILTINCYSQKFVFDYYGLKNDYTNNMVVFSNAELKIEQTNKDNYSITAFDPRDKSISLLSSLKYVKFNELIEKHFYKGVVKFGEIEYGCIVTTITKLSDFAKGIGNDNNFAYFEKFEIKFIYGLKTINPSNYSNTVSIYPINDKEEKEKNKKIIIEQQDKEQEIQKKGYSFELSNREIITITRPELGKEKGIIIVVDIKVDRNGVVKEARGGVRGTTVLRNDLYKLAEEAALKTIFNPSKIAPETQRGTITYWVIND